MRAGVVELVDRVAVGVLVERRGGVAAVVVLLGHVQDGVVVGRVHEHCMQCNKGKQVRRFLSNQASI